MAQHTLVWRGMGVVGMLVVTWSLVQPGADDATERGRALYAHTVRSVMALRGKAVSRTMPPASTIQTSWRWPARPFSRPRLLRAVGAQPCMGGHKRLAVRCAARTYETSSRFCAAGSRRLPGSLPRPEGEATQFGGSSSMRRPAPLAMAGKAAGIWGWDLQ